MWQFDFELNHRDYIIDSALNKHQDEVKIHCLTLFVHIWNTLRF